MVASSSVTILGNALRLTFPVTVALTVYLYLFPLFQSCAFPLPVPGGVDAGFPAFRETAALHWPFLVSKSDSGDSSSAPIPLAPFRLLALGDPQLEGDTSIPNAHGPSFPHLWRVLSHIAFQSEHASLLQRIRQSLHDIIDIFFADVPNTIESVRKRIDLFGNDFYLAHIYRTLHWWARPTHVAVLGDLVGSQWLPDDEFERRAERYWKRVFRRGERVPDDVARQPAADYDLAGYLGTPSNNESEVWARRVINVAGNHDIGYAGDINDERYKRFEKAFGKANYELRFELPIGDGKADGDVIPGESVDQTHPERLVPELRIVVLNDMNLDTPALSTELQDVTYNFINSVINTATAVEYAGHFTILLTHVPLYKPEGVCVDSPFFDFHEHDGTLKEQNQLSADASRGFLEGIYGMNRDTNAPGKGRGRPGVILNGHDHEGCDTWHFINQTHSEEPGDKDWQTWTWERAQVDGLPGRLGYPGIREVTVRSMMGDFGGNAGLLSVWFDRESWQWRFEYVTCPLGPQHLWWTVHIMHVATLLAALTYGICIGLLATGVDVDAWITRGVRWLRDRYLKKSHVLGNGAAKSPKISSP